MTMGGLVENSIRQSIRALRNSDINLAEQVVEDDHRIDALQDEIHMAAVNCIALRQPQASDLRMVVAIMRITNALERAADHAKNTAKRASSIVQTPPQSGAVKSLDRLATTTHTLLKDSLDAFIQADEKKALDVISRDQDVDQMYSSLFREYLTYMLEDASVITPTMHLIFIAKNIERIGDHSTAIAEQTVYMVTGSLPEGERPKGDDSVYLAGTEQN